jgi:hypothetical protein
VHILNLDLSIVKYVKSSDGVDMIFYQIYKNIQPPFTAL